jgi:hypothetical protein
MRVVKILCRSLVLLLCLGMGLLGSSIFNHTLPRLAAAPLPQEATWVVTYPADGTVVSGEVTVVGTASHPNFDSYGLLYASGPVPTATSNWIPLVFGEKTMVVNGPLATWDTTALPNGQYTLALALYEVGNSEPKLFFVNNITIQNEELTPTPTPTETPEPTQEPVDQAPSEASGPIEEAPPVGPTVEMPPTVTPRPTPTLTTADAEAGVGGAESAASSTDASSTDDTVSFDAFFAPEALRKSFCSGVQLAILLYMLGGIYAMAKVGWRYYQRYQHQQRTDPQQPRRQAG